MIKLNSTQGINEKFYTRIIKYLETKFTIYNSVKISLQI
jgi:uncharacterized protein YmfQ (DUF2313 family)